MLIHSTQCHRQINQQKVFIALLHCGIPHIVQRYIALYSKSCREYLVKIRYRLKIFCNNLVNTPFVLVYK